MNINVSQEQNIKSNKLNDGVKSINIPIANNQQVLHQNSITKNNVIFSSNNNQLPIKETFRRNIVVNTPVLASVNADETNNNIIVPTTLNPLEKINYPYANNEINLAVNNKIDTKEEKNYSLNETPERNKEFITDIITKLKPIENASNNDKAWVNYTLNHIFRKKILKEKISYKVYATPNLSFRKLSSKSPNNDNSISKIISTLNQQPALGMEVGVGINYTLLKNMRLKTGLQFNYTNYSIRAFEMNHPVSTTLLMTDNVSDYSYYESKSTSLSNITDVRPVNFHNKTYQISIPLGIEYKLAGRNKVQWYIGTSIQPTYLFSGNAYLISSDAKNYVKDHTLINKWNVNTDVETYISYNTKNNIRLQFGPQYRYQLTSTYKKYSISENLYHLGIKFGVSKNL